MSKRATYNIKGSHAHGFYLPGCAPTLAQRRAWSNRAVATKAPPPAPGARGALVKRFAKCRAQKHIFCTAMDASLHPDDTPTKGLNMLQLYNMKTLKPSNTLIVYKTSARDRGICLNMCPWCGESVRPDIARAKPGEVVGIS